MISQAKKSIYLIGIDSSDILNCTLQALKKINEAESLILSKKFNNDCIKILRQNNQKIYYEEELSRNNDSILWNKIIKLLDSNEVIAHLIDGDPLLEKKGVNELKFFKEKKINCEVFPSVIGFIDCLNKNSDFLTDREKNSSATIIKKFNTRKISQLINKSYFEKLIIFLESEKEYDELRILLEKKPSKDKLKINLIKKNSKKLYKLNSGQFSKESYIIIENNE